jgi:hypothetical protein
VRHFSNVHTEDTELVRNTLGIVHWHIVKLTALPASGQESGSVSSKKT